MFVFFIRKSTDVDHVVPVIYRMAKDNVGDLLVLCLNPAFDLSDFRLQYLKREYKVNIEYAYKYHCPTGFHKILGTLLCNPVLRRYKNKGFKTVKEFKESGREGTNLGLLTYLLFFIFKIFNKFFYQWVDAKLIKKRFFSQKWAEDFFDYIKPSLVVFDHTHSEVHNISALIAASKKLGIKSVFLPHGVPLFTEPVFKKLEGGKGLVYRPIVATNPDFMVINHKHVISSIVQHGFSSDKLSILGSARFCKEWANELHKITPYKNLEFGKNEKKLKVVYMERGNDRYGGVKNQVRETLVKMSELDFVHLIIMKHAGTDRIHFQALPSSIDVVYSIDAVNVCRWADAVLCLVSSISLEVLIQDKALIYPKYFDERQTLTEEMGACWTVNNYEELENALITLEENPLYRPYRKENVEIFFDEVVYGGVKDRDVLGDYENFLLQTSCLSKQEPTFAN